MSLFRSALQVSPERVVQLDDIGLNALMTGLLKAQAYVAGANPAQLIINTERRAGDGGADATSPKPQRDDHWLGDRQTCWQFKSGTAGQPARLHGEVLKDIPKRTLLEGGRYVVACCASNRGDDGEADRLEVLVKEARAAGIPTDHIAVFGSEALTTWCNQHPAVAAAFAGRPDGLWRLVDWEQSDEHEVEWLPTQAQMDMITRLRGELDLLSGTTYHVHVHGHPGVGKSRFALELCREAGWAPFVIYVRQAQDLRLAELIDSCVADAGVQLAVVADEVTLEQLLPLRASISRADGRVRLISIGTSRSPEPARIQPFEVRPMPEHEVTKIVQRWHTGMPIEQAQFVAEFSAGYMRLAKLAASAVHRNPRMDVRTMLEQHDVKTFLDAMLGNEARGSLHVVAALTSVGWTDEDEREGKVVAAQLGLSWTQVRRDVDRFHERFQIAPRGGRLRYISPRPLGIYLALEAWRVYTSEMRSLPGVLSAAGVDAYYERLEDLASSSQAGEFGREQLDAFFPVADLNDARMIRRWSALSFANPGMAASRMRSELARRTREERMAIRSESRRWLVSTFVGLSWSTETFADASHSLALLAEAETDGYASNATGEFLHRFNLFLSGTATPYRERLRALDELLASESPQLRELTVRALGQVVKRDGFRTHRKPITRGMPEEEWQPASGHEHLDAFLSGVSKLRDVVAEGDPSLSKVIGEVVPDFAQRLFENPIRDTLIELLLTTSSGFQEHRETIRRRVTGRLNQIKKYRKDTDPQAIAAVEALLSRLRDESPVGRLRELIGPGSSSEEKGQIQALAAEFAAYADMLRPQWAWLTSGEGNQAWAFGRELGASNLDELVSELIRSPLMGHDGRLVCGYLERRAADEGTGWLDAWLDAFDTSAQERGDLVLEATWRLTLTERGAARVRRVLDARRANAETINQLAYGSWEARLDRDALKIVLEALADHPEGARAAATILHSRLSKHGGELEYWEQLALRLATTRHLIRDRQDDGYDWSELAKLLVERDPLSIFAAILEQQNIRDDSGSWFLDHSLASVVVWTCVEKDPVGMWEITYPYFEQDYSSAHLFIVGFPDGLIDHMDTVAVLRWAAKEPSTHAALLAHVVAVNFNEGSLAAALIDAYGNIDEVSSAFRSRTVTGSWSGPASAHWASKASHMRDVAASTSLPGLRRWALLGAEDLDRMAERDRIREEEEELRGRN